MSLATQIHPTAVIEAGAQLGEGVEIGPFCVIGANAKIGDRTQLQSHVVVTGNTTMGSDNRIFPFTSIGQIPQDLKFHGEPSEVVIGNNNQIRENVTINAGTEGGGMITRMGDNNLLMAYTHIAHDCILGNGIVLANCATLAGHVEVDDMAIIGGLSAIQQFVRIGKLAMIGGMSGVTKDVAPYCLVAGGYRSGLSGLNLVGLKRKGFTTAQIGRMKEVYRLLLQERGKRDERLAEAELLIGADDEAAAEIISFVRSAKRGLMTHAREQSRES